MDKLNDTYEGIELLKALDLPVESKQSKKRRLPDYKTLQFFDYEQCFAFYAKRILNIRQAKIRGEVIVAKPVLLLALIDGISKNIFIDNEFVLNEWLESRYLMLMREYTRSSQFTNVTGIENPFWHLATDGFWNLQYRQAPLTDASPSKRWLKENVEFAYFDEALWILLQNKIWRTQLREYIIDHKLTDSSLGNTIKASGLGIFAAFLLTA